MPNILNSEGNSIEQWSLLKLVQLAWIGSLLIASQFLWVALHEGFIRLHDHFFGPRLSLFAMTASILLLLAPILIGTVLITLAYWWLSDGLTRIKWTESEIETARFWVESHDLNRTTKWLLWSFVFVEIVVSYFAWHVWNIPHHRSTRLFFDSLTLVCIPSLVVPDMGDRLRQEVTTHTLSDGGPRRHQRFHSEHWGER
jgi:hypothetical protein